MLLGCLRFYAVGGAASGVAGGRVGKQAAGRQASRRQAGRQTSKRGRQRCRQAGRQQCRQVGRQAGRQAGKAVPAVQTGGRAGRRQCQQAGKASKQQAGRRPQASRQQAALDRCWWRAPAQHGPATSPGPARPCQQSCGGKVQMRPQRNSKLNGFERKNKENVCFSLKTIEFTVALRPHLYFASAALLAGPG